MLILRRAAATTLFLLALSAASAASAGATPFSVGALANALAPTNPIVNPVGYDDPSGLVSDASTHDPLTNATVTLYRVPGWTARASAADNAKPNTCESNNSKPDGARWSQPAPTNEGQEADTAHISPARNPLYTGSDGRYGWTVPNGCWYVLVTNPPDYYATASFVVGTPPAVSDLNVALKSTSGDAGGGTDPGAGGDAGGGGAAGDGGGRAGSGGGGSTNANAKRSCKVPRVIGYSLARARRALSHAHCKTGSVRKVRSKVRQRGRVLAQRPRAGTRKRAGARVALRLAK